MYDICEVIITAPDPDWLTDVARYLVGTGLAACAFVAPIRLICRSQGGVQEGVEFRVALHTRRSSVAAIVEHLIHEHPHDVPCVFATPITDGNPTYLQWVRDQTRVTR